LTVSVKTVLKHIVQYYVQCFSAVTVMVIVYLAYGSSLELLLCKATYVENYYYYYYYYYYYENHTHNIQIDRKTDGE